MVNFKLSRVAKERMVLVIRLLAIFLFSYTAYAKLVDHERFFNGLANVQLIRGMADYIAWLVPLAEIVVAVLLLLPATARWGLYAFAGLLVLFSGYIISALMWEKTLPCHCGGVIEEMSWTQHLLFNLFFIGLGAIALRLNKQLSKLKLKK